MRGKLGETRVKLAEAVEVLEAEGGAAVLAESPSSPLQKAIRAGVACDLIRSGIGLKGIGKKIVHMSI